MVEVFTKVVESNCDVVAVIMFPLLETTIRVPLGCVPHPCPLSLVYSASAAVEPELPLPHLITFDLFATAQAVPC